MSPKIDSRITFPTFCSFWLVCCRRLFRSSSQSPLLSPTHWNLHTRTRSMCYWTFPFRHLLCWWRDLSRRRCWVSCSRSWMIPSSTHWTRTMRPRLMAWAMELNWTRLYLLWLLFWQTLLRLEEKAGKPWRPGSCPTTCKWSRHGHLLSFKYVRSSTANTNTWLYCTFSVLGIDRVHWKRATPSQQGLFDEWHRRGSLRSRKLSANCCLWCAMRIVSQPQCGSWGGFPFLRQTQK